jgi:phage terminase small subunit
MAAPICEYDDEHFAGLRTDRQVLFAIEYCVDFNATAAAKRSGYAERSAAEIGCELLRKPQIQAAIERRLSAVANAAEVNTALVISELYAVAMADPRALFSLHRGACRYCYGIDHCYMFTPAEYKRALDEALNEGLPAPDFAGGIGYDFTLDPSKDCPECRGFGTERVFVKDTRKLSKGAAKLLSSMKQTKDGSIEIKTRDQDGALIALGRVVGAFKDRQEISGPGGSPLQLQPVPASPHSLSNEQLEEILHRNGHHLIEGATNAQ